MAGTRFRTMLAPIGTSTGDGRRFASGSITLADLPIPLEWPRRREGGHDGAVTVGVIQEAAVMSIGDALAGDWISPEAAKGMDQGAEAVFARGAMFDDVDRETMPTLAEDVATALHLAGEGTLGPSVDLDSFEARPVMTGTDEEMTWDAIEEYMAANGGSEPPMELLISTARVRAATLVPIPAFSETSRPFELIEPDPEQSPEDNAQTGALVASMASATATRHPATLFDRPSLSGPTPITWDWAGGRVFGHIAMWRTCHTGYGDVCVTPPREAESYAWFNRFTVDTEDGSITAGRITVGGRHAAMSLSASGAMADHDGKTVAAYVRAYADDHGIVVAGAIEPGLSAGDRAILDRRKVSGDWREIGGALSLVEVLALSPGPRSQSEPGFPVQTFAIGQRQISLVASFGPDPAAFRSAPALDVEEIVRRTLAVERELAETEARGREARTELSQIILKEDDAARAELASVLGDD